MRPRGWTKTKERSSCCIHFDHHQLIKAKDHRTLITKVLFLCQPPASGRSTRNNSFLPDDISAKEPSHPYHQKILWLKAKYHEKCQILLSWSPKYKGNLKTKIISIIISEDFFSIKHDLARLCFMLYISWTFGTSPEPSIEKKYVVKFNYEVYNYE